MCSLSGFKYDEINDGMPFNLIPSDYKYYKTYIYICMRNVKSEDWVIEPLSYCAIAWIS